MFTIFQDSVLETKDRPTLLLKTNKNYFSVKISAWKAQKILVILVKWKIRIFLIRKIKIHEFQASNVKDN